MEYPIVTARYGGYLREAPIKIFAGREKTVYYVHPGMFSLCKASTATVRMNGHWKETGGGTIDWTDFDEQTVENVLHYLYTGDYHIPESEEEPKDYLDGNTMNVGNQGEEVATTAATDEHLLGESPIISQDTINRPSAITRPLTPIDKCIKVEPAAESRQRAAGVLVGKDSTRYKSSLKSSILAHAKVYSFAHQHFFSCLATLALQRLTQVLRVVPCEPTALFPHLGEAIRHVYEATLKTKMQENPARKLLSQYVALNYAHLAGEELEMLAEEGGEIMIDISLKLTRLLASNKAEIDRLELRVNDLSQEVDEMEIKLKNEKARNPSPGYVSRAGYSRF